MSSPGKRPCNVGPVSPVAEDGMFEFFVQHARELEGSDVHPFATHGYAVKARGKAIDGASIVKLQALLVPLSWMSPSGRFLASQIRDALA